MSAAPFDMPGGAPRLLLAIALLAGLTGCGGAAGQVSGRVTAQGQAVPKAELVFALENQPAEVFYGVSQDDGTYVVDVAAKRGLPPGKYQVTVTDYVQPDGTPVPGGEEGVVLRNSGRAIRRTHALTKEVAAGANEIELKLEEGQLLPQPEPE
jgi:hypothetical protein